MDPSWSRDVKMITAKTEQLFHDLHTIWDEIGFKGDCREAYCKQACKHLEDLMNAMRDEAQTKKDELFKAIKILLEEIYTISKELKTESALKDYNNEDQPLVDVRSELESQVERLKNLKAQRLNYLQELLQKERAICKTLGIKPMDRSEGVPSNEELESFKIYLQHQEAEKNRLEIAFKEMRHSIMQMMDEMKSTPSLEIEHVICTNPENFVLTTNNMQKLRELRDSINETLNSAREAAKSKREKLIELYNYLELPEDSCQAFLNKHSGCSLPDLHAMNEEIKQCREKRSENIAKYVEKARENLRKLWDTCKFSDAQRDSFKAFYVQKYTDDLLTRHDLEIERVQEYYNKNKQIYELLDECQSLWRKANELDERSNNPGRLNNRGGRLLTEEKERNTIRRKLPKIEEQLAGLMRAYEVTNSEPFTIFGQTFSDFRTQCMQDYFDSLETLKKSRQDRIKDKTLRKTPVMSISRRTPKTTSSLLGKREHESASRYNRSPAKQRLIQSEKTIRPTLCTSKVRRSGRLPRRLLGPSQPTSSNRSTRAQTANDTQNTIDSISQYDQFSDHLNQREELRSSVLPEQILSTHIKRMKTPVKTPVKPLRKNLSVNTPNKTPKTSHVRESSRSPRAITSTPRLAAAPNKLPVFF